MRWFLSILALVWVACAPKNVVTKADTESPEYPGGDCSWSVQEGGAECVVSVGGETRWRSPGTTDEIEATQGYGKKKWKCGEKRQVCGTEVECTCPFPVTPDGGS